MLAHHPITGKEIRIIQTRASLWKENKTLLFSDEPSVYDTIHTLGSPTYLIQIDSSSTPSLVSSPTLIFSTARAVQSKNTIILEELHKLYPHLGSEWDGTLEDAVAMIAGLLRYRSVGGISPNKRSLSLGLVQSTIPPLKLWWVTQYYSPSQREREREIKTCLERNSKSSLIDRIILLNEKEEDFQGISFGKVPVEQRVIGKRLSYADVMKAAADFPDVIVAFANADICIDDESWRQLWNVDLDGKFLAILRYDVPASWKTSEAKLFGPRADSQDTWVMKACEIQKIASYTNMNIPFGKMGCDNAIAMEMLRQKLVVVNPALSLKTWHFHNSDVRGYVKTDVVDAPMFHYITPSGFHDLQPILTFPSSLSPILSPLSLPILGSAATTWIVAKNKKSSVPYKLESDNTYVPKSEYIVPITNCFQTSEGIAFDRDHMYIGSSKRAEDVWSKSTMSPLTPSIQCKRGLIAHWAGSSREEYMLHYLSKVFRMKSATEIVAESWEMFCPEEKMVIESLEIFCWNTKKLPVIKHEKDMLVWCEEALCMPVSDNACVLREDIEALRRSLRLSSTCDTKKLIFVQDGTVLTDTYVLSMEALLDKEYDVKVVYPGKTSAHRMIEVFSGAHAVVCKSGIQACGWNWVLPTGALVFECTSDGDSSGIELSAASDLQHFFIKKENLLNELNPSENNLPVVWLPRSEMTGYFAHPGDSFREMVRLWGSAGFCQVKEHPTATMVWWDKVGKDGILLYDRPNHDWRLAAPSDEQEWSFALFGNPKPFEGSPWFFWPRRPELVEAMAKMERVPWKFRVPGAVFYGKIENKVQERRRPLNWESACSEWKMVRGNEPYPFTHSEYLEKLSKSRFALCLPGYGYKCHREIEAMAMGCVPLCALDVDMTSYAVAPIEGVHYIRVEDPESVAVVSEMSENTWNRMSSACIQWWTDNSSCQGSFLLTKRLIERKSVVN